MNDNPLIGNLITVIQTGLTVQGLSVGIQQAYQPQEEGSPSAPVILLHKIGDKRYGWPKRSDVFNSDTGIMTHTELELMETTYQCDALAIQNPSNVTQLTAADYLKSVAMVLQSDACVTSLEMLGIGILRIQQIKQTYFQDDKGRFEASPMFEFTVTHTNTLSQVINSTSTVTAGIFPY